MAYSYTTAFGDGSTTTFTFSFIGPEIGYYDEDQVIAYVNGIMSDRTLTGPNQVTFAVAPEIDADILIVREPDISNTYTNFLRGNVFGKDNLNRAFQQCLYLIQRLQDGFYDVGHYLKQNLNMGYNRIINLADGEKPSDAVSLSQLSSAISSIYIPFGTLSTVTKLSISSVGVDIMIDIAGYEDVIVTKNDTSAGSVVVYDSTGKLINGSATLEIGLYNETRFIILQGDRRVTL